jgi:hypothetical protein
MAQVPHEDKNSEGNQMQESGVRQKLEKTFEKINQV